MEFELFKGPVKDWHCRLRARDDRIVAISAPVTQQPWVYEMIEDILKLAKLRPVRRSPIGSA